MKLKTDRFVVGVARGAVASGLVSGRAEIRSHGVECA